MRFMFFIVSKMFFELVCQGVYWFEVKQAQAPLLMKIYCMSLLNILPPKVLGVKL